MPVHVTLSSIADLINGYVIGEGEKAIFGIASVEECEGSSLTFVWDKKYLPELEEKEAAGVLLEEELLEEVQNRYPKILSHSLVVVRGARAAFVKLLKAWEAQFQEVFIPKEEGQWEDRDLVRGKNVKIFPNVYIGRGVRLGDGVVIYPGCVVMDEVVIGNDSLLYPNVVLGRGTILGKNVTLHAGVVIGTDGFGYVSVSGKLVKVPQLGIVQLEDDVEIGANTTIDRATVSRTLIKRGTKIDNLVHIAHNVVIGEDGILCGQVGIAGSTRIGDRVMIGGKAGIVDNRRIGDDVKISPNTGVIKNIASGQYMSGFVARPHKEYLYYQALLSRLPRLFEDVSGLKSLIKEKK